MRATSADARTQAERLIRSGTFGSTLARNEGVVLPAITVEDPDGEAHSWFVPVAAGQSLLGFFELGLDLTPLRYSSFQRQDDTADGCPEVRVWCDPAAVAQRAAAAVSGGTAVGEPRLSYDRTPARLAWRVRVRAGDGREHTVMVAGDAAWEAPPADEGSFGARPER